MAWNMAPTAELVPFEDCYERLLSMQARVPEQLAARSGPMLLFNNNGAMPPIFWCFNDLAEPALLARKIGAEQPIAAMLSLNGIIEREAEKHAYGWRLAQHYASQILDRFCQDPIILGGNCQSARIMEMVAHIVIAKTGQKPLLFTLEYMPRYCYPGPLVMMFGSKSLKFNPFLKGEDPIPWWRSQHKCFAWGTVTGGHGEYFIEPGVWDLVHIIKRAVRMFGQTGAIEIGDYSPRKEE